MLVDDGNGILENLRGAVDGFVAVFVERELLLVIAQTAEEAFAKIAAADTGRIELANDFEGFLQILGGEFGGCKWGARERAVMPVRARGSG